MLIFLARMGELGAYRPVHRLRSEVAPVLAVMRQVHQQLAHSDERLVAIAQTDARVRCLQSAPHINRDPAPASAGQVRHLPAALD